MSPATTSSWFFSPTPPSNNAFNSSESLMATPHWWVGGYNSGATRQTSEPAQTGECTVWYSLFLGGHQGNITFTIDRAYGDLSNVVLTAWKGFSIGSLTLLAQATGPAPSITFPYNYSDGIKICVGGATTADQGGFVLTWDMAYAQANHTWSAATTLAGASGTLTAQDATGSCREVGDPGFNYMDGVDAALWYKYTAAADGFVDFTVDLTNGGEFMVLRAPTFETASKVQRVTTTNPLYSGTAGTPISAGETVYVEVNPYQVGSSLLATFDISWAFNAHLPVDYYDAGENQYNTPGSYDTIEVYTDAAHRRRGDWHYVSFYVRAESMTIPTSAEDPFTFPRIAQARNSAGQRIWALDLSCAYQGDKFGGAIAHLAHNYTPGYDNDFHTNISSHQLRAQPTHVEIFFQSSEQVYAKGTPQVYIFVDGEMAATHQNWAYTPADGGFRYLDIGQVYNPNSWALDLRFTHIHARNLRSFKPPAPELAPTAKRIFRAQGWEQGIPLSEWNYYKWDNFDHSMQSEDAVQGGARAASDAYFIPQTATMYLDDTPGRGKGIRFVGANAFQQADQTFQYAAPQYFPSVDWSWWIYVDAMPTSPVGIFTLTDQYVGEPVTHYDIASIMLMPNGTCVLCAGATRSSSLIGGDKVWSTRKIELNTWAHVEFAVDYTDERPVIHWWLNGEEQPQFEPLRYAEETRNRAISGSTSGFSWSHPFSFAGNPGGSCWMTDMVLGPYFGERIGPVRTQLLLPNSSGTHVPGTKPSFYDPSAYPATITVPYAFFSTTDNGATQTDVGTTGTVHTFIDDWPPTVTASSDFIGQASWGTGTYIEYGYQDVDSGATVLGINAHLAVRGFHMNYDYGYFFTVTWYDWNPSASDHVVYSFWWLHDPGSGENMAGGSIAEFLFGSDGLTRRYMSTGTWTRGFGGAAWTPAMLNAAVGRWGERGNLPYPGGGAPNTPGIALLAQAIEAIIQDDYPTLTATAAAPNALVWWDWSNDTTTTKDSCVSQDPADPATDPNMDNAVFWAPYLGSDQWYDSRRDVEWYWRVTPAQHKTSPGYDGNYHDTNGDRLAGTTSHKTLFGPYFPFANDGQDGQYDFPDYAIWQYPTTPDGVKWDNNYEYYYYGTGVPPIQWNFDPCLASRLGIIDPVTRQVTLQAYVRDSAGKTSPVATLTWTINQGSCCAVTGIKFHTDVTRRV